MPSKLSQLSQWCDLGGRAVPLCLSPLSVDVILKMDHKLQVYGEEIVKVQ